MSPKFATRSLPAAASTWPENLAGAAGRTCRAAILWAHAAADRLDWLPSEWGRDAEVDMADAGAVAGEWVRRLRHWAADYPEDALAWKIGAAVLAAVLAGLVAVVGVIR